MYLSGILYNLPDREHRASVVVLNLSLFLLVGGFDVFGCVVVDFDVFGGVDVDLAKLGVGHCGALGCALSEVCCVGLLRLQTMGVRGLCICRYCSSMCAAFKRSMVTLSTLPLISTLKNLARFSVIGYGPR